MSRARVTYVEIDSNKVRSINSVKGGEGRKVLEYEKNIFHLRKNFFSKKMKKTFKVYYCKYNRMKGRNCTVSIREDRNCVPNKYYLSMRQHDHSEKSANQAPPLQRNVRNQRVRNLGNSNVPQPPPPQVTVVNVYRAGTQFSIITYSISRDIYYRFANEQYRIGILLCDRFGKRCQADVIDAVTFNTSRFEISLKTSFRDFSNLSGDIDMHTCFLFLDGTKFTCVGESILEVAPLPTPVQNDPDMFPFPDRGFVHRPQPQQRAVNNTNVTNNETSPNVGRRRIGGETTPQEILVLNQNQNQQIQPPPHQQQQQQQQPIPQNRRIQTNSPRENNINTNQRRKKRRRDDGGPNNEPNDGLHRGTSRIHHVYPAIGPLQGNETVDIYFSVSTRDYFERLRQNENIISSVSFGLRGARFQSRALLVEQKEFELEDMDERDRRLCDGAQFVLPVKSPSVERPQTVNVSLLLLIERLQKENCYTYVDPKSMDQGDSLFSTIKHRGGGEEEEEEDDFGDFDKLSRFNFGADYADPDAMGLFDQQENDNDVFGADPMFYAVSRGNINLVKRLVLEKNYHFDRPDLMGLTAVDVAFYFQQVEILNFFRDQVMEIKKKKKNGFSEEEMMNLMKQTFIVEEEEEVVEEEEKSEEEEEEEEEEEKSEEEEEEEEDAEYNPFRVEVAPIQVYGSRGQLFSHKESKNSKIMLRKGLEYEIKILFNNSEESDFVSLSQLWRVMKSKDRRKKRVIMKFKKNLGEIEIQFKHVEHYERYIQIFEKLLRITNISDGGGGDDDLPSSPISLISPENVQSPSMKASSSMEAISFAVNELISQLSAIPKPKSLNVLPFKVPIPFRSSSNEGGRKRSKSVSSISDVTTSIWETGVDMGMSSELSWGNISNDIFELSPNCKEKGYPHFFELHPSAWKPYHVISWMKSVYVEPRVGEIITLYDYLSKECKCLELFEQYLIDFYRLSILSESEEEEEIVKNKKEGEKYHLEDNSQHLEEMTEEEKRERYFFSNFMYHLRLFESHRTTTNSTIRKILGGKTKKKKHQQSLKMVKILKGVCEGLEKNVKFNMARNLLLEKRVDQIKRKKEEMIIEDSEDDEDEGEEEEDEEDDDDGDLKRKKKKKKKKKKRKKKKEQELQKNELKLIEIDLDVNHRFWWDIEACRDHILSLLLFNKPIDEYLSQEFQKFKKSSQRRNREEEKITLFHKLEQFNHIHGIELEKISFDVYLEKKIYELRKRLREEFDEPLNQKLIEFDEKTQSDPKINRIERAIEVLKAKHYILSRQVDDLITKSEQEKEGEKIKLMDEKRKIEKRIVSEETNLEKQMVKLREKLLQKSQKQLKIEEKINILIDRKRFNKKEEEEEEEEEKRKKNIQEEKLAFSRFGEQRREMTKTYIFERLREECQLGIKEFTVSSVISVKSVKNRFIEGKKFYEKKRRKSKKSESFTTTKSEEEDFEWEDVRNSIRIDSVSLDWVGDGLVVINSESKRLYDEIIALDCKCSLIANDLKSFYKKMNDLSYEIVHAGVNCSHREWSGSSSSQQQQQQQQQQEQQQDENVNITSEDFCGKIVNILGGITQFQDVNVYLNELRKILVKKKSKNKKEGLSFFETEKLRFFRSNWMFRNVRFKGLFNNLFYSDERGEESPSSLQSSKSIEFKASFSSSKIYFNRYNEVEVFLRECRKIDGDFEVHYPGIHQLLKGFGDVLCRKENLVCV